MIASLSIHKKGNRICWYRMEQEDRDLSVFYAYLKEALFPNDDPQWEESRNLLENFADYKSQHRYINAIICQELWAYCNINPNIKTFIAFDDFHHVKDSPEISESIAYFINNLPTNCTVLLSSRQQVNLLSEKRKLDKNILEIDQNDLCFIEKEVADLLKKSYQVNIDKKLLHKILSGTEGWIAGIIMICQVLSDSDTLGTGSVLEKPWQKAKLFSYMTSEVLKTIDIDMMQFLVKAAILQDFTEEEAEQILELSNTAHLIAQCEKKGLFLQKIIRDNHITYRFHPLFRDALLQLESKYLTLEEIKRLNLKAASYYIKHKIFGRAIEHFILCGDVNSAVQLITMESINLMTFESIQQLRIWLNILPQAVVEENPSLLYIKSFTYQQTKGDQTIPLMEKAFVKFKENNDVIMQVYALVALIHYYMFANSINKLLDAISEALSILERIDEPKIAYMTDVLLFIRAVYEEKFSKAMVLSKDLQFREMDEDWKWVVTAHSCMLGYLTGALDYSESAINEGLENILAKRGEFFNALALTYYSTVLYLKNDTTALEVIESKLTEIGERYEYNFMLGFCKRASAFKKYVMHDTDNAIELLHSSISHFEQYGNKVMPEFNKLLQLLWLTHQENSEEQLLLAKKILGRLSSMRSGFCILEISQSIFGAIARECGEYKLGEEYLLTSIKSSETKGAKQVLCGSYMHLAKLYFDIEENEKAEDYLMKALRLASNNRYSMFWDIHLPTLTEMLVRSIKSDIYGDYARKLIKFYFKHKAVTYIDRNIFIIDDASIRDFSNSILSKYSIDNNTDYSCSIDICLLGKFSISVNGILIRDDEWKTKKIKGILEYLSLHKGKSVTRDLLMEIFWPDSDKKSAAASLRAALYELKKVLAKYGIKNDGDASFIHEKAGSLEIKPNNMLSIDTELFLSLFDEYKSKCKKNIDKKQLLSILEKTNSIYSGDLLSAEIYADWTFTDRETYKTIFQETVTALASLYIEENEINMAEKLLLRTLSIDPYNEEACLMLIKLYVSVNQRSRAAKLYLDFEKRLIKDLDIKPNEKLSKTMKII